MGVKVDYDTANRLVIVTEAPIVPTGSTVGLQVIDVEIDLYSDGKEDWNANVGGNLRKNRFPFITAESAGDSLPGGQVEPAFFRFRNDLGWRILPHDSDHEITLLGNIVPTDASLPIFTPRVGRSILIFRDGSQVAQMTSNTVADAVWEDTTDNANGSKGGLLNHLKHLSFRVYIDETLAEIGDGSQGYPFNDITIAIDYCEANGITDLMLKSDITLDRNLKNFRITGIGNPTVDTNGKDLTGSEFFHCNMEGDYIGRITVQQAVLRNNFWLNGFFERCTIEGNLYCKDDSLIVMLYCSSAIAGVNRPAIYGNVAGFCNLNIRDYVGGMNVRNFTQELSVMTIDGKGALTFEASNTNGVMVARGRWEPFSNLTNGATVLTPVGDQSKIDTIPEDVMSYTR